MATEKKDLRCLLIVESPNKVATFKHILPDNFIDALSAQTTANYKNGGEII